MAKNTNNDRQYNKQQTKDWARRAPLNTGANYLSIFHSHVKTMGNLEETYITVISHFIDRLIASCLTSNKYLGAYLG